MILKQNRHATIKIHQYLVLSFFHQTLRYYWMLLSNHWRKVNYEAMPNVTSYLKKHIVSIIWLKLSRRNIVKSSCVETTTKLVTMVTFITHTHVFKLLNHWIKILSWKKNRIHNFCLFFGLSSEDSLSKFIQVPRYQNILEYAIHKQKILGYSLWLCVVKWFNSNSDFTGLH